MIFEKESLKTNSRVNENKKNQVSVTLRSAVY